MCVKIEHRIAFIFIYVGQMPYALAHHVWKQKKNIQIMCRHRGSIRRRNAVIRSFVRSFVFYNWINWIFNTPIAAIRPPIWIYRSMQLIEVMWRATKLNKHHAMRCDCPSNNFNRLYINRLLHSQSIFLFFPPWNSCVFFSSIFFCFIHLKNSNCLHALARTGTVALFIP